MPQTERPNSWTISNFAFGNTVAKANKARRDWEQWYQAEPLVVLGVSLGLGIFLGWLVKRR